jgi:hypothetical protein
MVEISRIVAKLERSKTKLWGTLTTTLDFKMQILA